MGTKKPTLLPRGVCPVYGREVALLADGTVWRSHRHPAGGWCSGMGKKAAAQ